MFTKDSEPGGATVELVSPDGGSEIGSGDSGERGGGGAGDSRSGSGNRPSGTRGIFKRRGDTGGTDTGTGEAEELPRGPARPPVTDTKKQPKVKLDVSTLVNVGVVGFFNTIAIATGHEHWLKEHQEVTEITVPLNAWINQLPAKTYKKLEANLAPACLVAGLASVLIPDIVEEVNIRKNESIGRSASQEGQQPRKGGVSPKARLGNVDQSRNGAGGEGHGHPSVPSDFARSAINDSYDV